MTTRSYDIYDARIGGGIATQNQHSTSCQGEECRPAVSSPPAAQTPISEVFSGSGNLTPPVEPKPGGAVKSVKVKKLTRAQELAKALKACAKTRKKKKRRACEARARKRYDTAHGAKRKGQKAVARSVRGEGRR